MTLEALLELLYHRLRSFSELPAFELLSVAASRTYFGGVSEALDDLSVSELAALSRTELKKLGLTTDDCEKIIKQIEVLVPATLPEDEEDAHQTPVNRSVHNSSTSRRVGYAHAADSDTVLSSVAQEQILTQTLVELTTWPALAVVGDTPLKAYWTDHNTTAPFEEMITFNQLARMSSRSLLAKRSMTAQKIVAITNAVRRAMKEVAVGGKAASIISQRTQTSDIVSGLTKGAPAADESLTKKLLAAALEELSEAQRARVLTKVALGGEANSATKTRMPHKKAKSRKSRSKK